MGTSRMMCTTASKLGTGSPTGLGAAEAEPEPSTRVPGGHGYPDSRVTIHYLLPF